MDIHRWWDGDPSETFWMEITQREDLGANLLAPKLDNDGRETWEYALILETRPGDTVFHWHRDGDHGCNDVRGSIDESNLRPQVQSAIFSLLVRCFSHRVDVKVLRV